MSLPSIYNVKLYAIDIARTYYLDVLLSLRLLKKLYIFICTYGIVKGGKYDTNYFYL